MSIESILKRYFATAEGKKKSAEEKKKALESGRSWGQPGGTAISKTEIMRAAQKLRFILLKYLASVGLDSITENEINIGPPKIGANGQISVDISFDEGAIQRSSLRPEEYPEGIENIVVHLTHGWSARGSVYGYWESAGRMAWSRSEFAGDDFMQEAISEFNALNLGVAELNEKYLT